jgi:hypothetical protein
MSIAQFLFANNLQKFLRFVPCGVISRCKYGVYDVMINDPRLSKSYEIVLRA